MVKKSVIIVFSVLLIDQIIKIWVKTHMTLGQEYHFLGDWGIIHFTENLGMAFGMQFAGSYGKLILSLFRLLAIGAIIYYLRTLIKSNANNGIIVSISFILAGAIGNMIDSAFYGLLFSASSFYSVAGFLPEEGGYAPLLYGKVVDMFYFPIIQGYYPDWFPGMGGKDFIFFRPVFNVADSAVTVGVALLIIFQKHFLKKTLKNDSENELDNLAQSDTKEASAEANTAS